MKKILKIAGILLTIFLISVANIFVINFFPFPYSRINLIFLYLLLVLIVDPDNSVVLWQGLALAFVSELFSSTPFGINMLSCMGTLVVSQWMLKNIFTNRSSYIVFLMSVLSIVLYRFQYFTYLSAGDFINHSVNSLNLHTFIGVFWEAFLTSAILFVLYFAGFRFNKKMDPMYLSADGKRF